MPNRFPKLHNAMWPGLVGKGSPGAEPFIDLDTMLDLSAKAEVNGQRFDGVDIFLFDPHINIDIGDDDLKRTADKIRAKNFVVGSVQMASSSAAFCVITSISPISFWGGSLRERDGLRRSASTKIARAPA